MKTGIEIAYEVQKRWPDFAAMDVNDRIVEEYAKVIEETRTEAYEAAFADAVKTLKHCGHLNAAALIGALEKDRKDLAEKRKAKTDFPALRESVPLPAS